LFIAPLHITLTRLQNDVERLRWQASGTRDPAPQAQLQSTCSDFFIGELDIRSFAIQFQH
jgi:hypothetical protein